MTDAQNLSHGLDILLKYDILSFSVNPYGNNAIVITLSVVTLDGEREQLFGLGWEYERVPYGSPTSSRRHEWSFSV